MRTVLIGIAVCVFAVSALVSQIKTTPSKNKTAVWSNTVVLNDDWLGIYKDKKWSELSTDSRTRITDHREAVTKFATSFALEEDCNGLILLLHSRTEWPLPQGQYWWLDLRLSPTKETEMETFDREIKSFNEHGRVPYVHIDNPWFNWSIEHYSSPGTFGTDGNIAEQSNESAESAAHSVCLFVKHDGAILGGTGVPKH
jgi:hypothetical protein